MRFIGKLVLQFLHCHFDRSIEQCFWVSRYPIIKINCRLVKSKVLQIKETQKISFLIFLININLWTGTSRQWTGPPCASDLLLLGDPLPAAASHAFSPPSRPRDQRGRVLRTHSLWAPGHAEIQTGASSGLHASLTSGQSHILKGQLDETGKKKADMKFMQ